MYTDVVQSQSAKKELFVFTRKLKRLLSDLVEENLSVSFGSDVIKLGPSDIVRAVSEMSTDTPSELSFRNIILECIVRCESRHKMSGIVAGLAFCESVLTPYFDKTLKKDLSRISLYSKKTNLEAAKKLLKRVTGDNFSKSILFDAIQLAGSEGRIVIDKSPSTETHIVTSFGYTFNASVDILFSKVSKINQWSRNNVLCLIVDGVIEKPSELEKILYSLSKNKMPAVIFARGFNEDVISTMAVNFIRGHLDVVPVCIPFDELGINTINDIAVVSGTDIVSSTKGELISQKSMEDLVLLDNVSIDIFSNKIIIGHSKTKQNVFYHLSHIKKKHESTLSRYANFEDQESVFEKRIMSLSGDSVKIKIGKLLGEKRGIIIDRVQFGLGLFNEICRFGFINLKEIQPKNKLIYKCVKNLIKIHSQIPTRSLLSGIQEGIKIADFSKKVGCIIYTDN